MDWENYGYGVIASRIAGVTAQNALYAEIKSLESTESLDAFFAVC